VRVRSWTGIILTIGLTAGCGGGIPKTHYYVLDLPAPAPAASTPSSSSPFTAMVLPFRAPEPLDQDRIVYSSSAVELNFYDYHRWAERPTILLTSALADHLRASHLFSSVSIFDGRTNADYMIRGRLQRLQEVDAEGGVTVRVQMAADALDARTNRVVWSAEASHSAQVHTPDVSAVVAEMSRGAEVCLGKITSDLENLRKAFPPAPVPSSAASR